MQQLLNQLGCWNRKTKHFAFNLQSGSTSSKRRNFGGLEPPKRPLGTPLVKTQIRWEDTLNSAILPGFPNNLSSELSYLGARGGAFGWGTALQTGRSLVRFPMVSLEFFIDRVLPASLRPRCWLSLYQKWVPGIFPGGKGGRCVGLTT